MISASIWATLFVALQLIATPFHAAMVMKRAKGKSARNEIRKLSASYLNTISAGVFLATLIIPLVSWVGAHPNDWPTFADFQVIFDYSPILAVSLASHLQARRMLIDMED